MSQGLSRLARVRAVLHIDDADDVEEALDDFIARADDGYWAHFVRQRFSWRRFTQWWIARRWIVPRDVRRR